MEDNRDMNTINVNEGVENAMNDRDAQPEVQPGAAPEVMPEPAVEVAESTAEPAAEPTVEPAAEPAVEPSVEPVAGAKPGPEKRRSPKAAMEARRAQVVQRRQAADAERQEKRQKRQEAAKKSKEERQQELERRKAQLVHTTAQMSDKLRQMLDDEIKAMQKMQKTRAAEILAIFAKHNFYAGGFTPVEMRTTLEDLGPTYVKIGQIMSSRVDLLPESYCRELEKLRQNVKELDPEIAKAVIEQETGKKIDELFLEFRDKPLGSASIGQAHLAVLKDGTQVVTKVQRPLIAEMMREDFVLLKKMATAVNVVKEADEDSEQMVDLLSVIEELEKVENEELDFRV